MRQLGNTADRVLHLLSSFSHLRNNNRVLVEELRGSVAKLRKLRQEMSRQRPTSPPLPSSDGGPDGLAARFGLTQREEEVALLLEQGKPNESIARELNISAHTARHHTQRILAKLQVHSRGEAGAKIRG